METLPAATIPTQPVRDRKWYEIWWDIWIHPGVDSFRQLSNEHDHSATRGFIWTGVVSLIGGLVFGLAALPYYTNNFGVRVGGAFLITLICSLILTPIFAIIGLIISTGIYHAISRIFHGSGDWSDLVISMAAVNAPASLIVYVIFTPLILLYGIQTLLIFLACTIGTISVLLGIYVIALNINALRASENQETGQAVATFFTPVVVVLIIAICISIAAVPAFIRQFQGY